MLFFGHRGAGKEAPENTIPGFRHADTLGVTNFELDVHLSRDEQVVVIHDAAVDRTTNGTGLIEDMDYDAIRKLDARGAFPDWPEPVRIPLLEEVFEAFPNAGYQIEIKFDPDDLTRLPLLCERVAQITDAFRKDDNVTIISFSTEALDHVRAVSPDRRLGLLGNYDTLDFVDLAQQHDCGVLCAYFLTCTPEIVQAAHDRGIRVTVWTPNTKGELQIAVDLGVDGLTSDVPSAALSFLADKGLWEPESAGSLR